MISLFIDTSSANFSLYIINENKVLYTFQKIINKEMASRIIPIIDNGLKQNNISLNDIDRIFVVNGPGSFTGIRVGVTVAKTIAWALKIDIIPISSLEFLATTTTNKKFVVPMIDARRGNVFAGIYDQNLNIVMSDRLININEILSKVNDDYETISYDYFNNDRIFTPSPDVIKIIDKHRNDKSINPHNINPNYLKLTEAEENKLKND